MRSILLTALILSCIFHLSYADTLEMPAGSATSLEIPANTSIRIGYVAGKGNASYSIKMKLNMGGTLHNLDYSGLGRAYINGPATLSSVALVSALSTGIRYKLSGFGSVQYDYLGNGSFGMSIPMNDGNMDYRQYLNWLAAGNTPLPADAYTGTDADISTSGLLIQYERIPNQPVRSLVVPADGSTQSITIPNEKKLVFLGNDGSSFLATIRNGYSVNTSLESLTIEGPDTLLLRSNTTTFSPNIIISRIFNYYFADESSLPVADSMVNAIANKITSAVGTYGIATKAELASSLTQSRTDGINSVLSNPNLWTLYTTSQIQNMAVGDLVLTKDVGGTFTLNYDIEQSTDLQTWTTYEALSLPLEGLPTDKAFVRLKMANSSSGSSSQAADQAAAEAAARAALEAARAALYQAEQAQREAILNDAQANLAAAQANLAAAQAAGDPAAQAAAQANLEAAQANLAIAQASAQVPPSATPVGSNL
jgi:hypothetical protein